MICWGFFAFYIQNSHAAYHQMWLNGLGPIFKGLTTILAAVMWWETTLTKKSPRVVNRYRILYCTLSVLINIAGGIVNVPIPQALTAVVAGFSIIANYAVPGSYIFRLDHRMPDAEGAETVVVVAEQGVRQGDFSY